MPIFTDPLLAIETSEMAGAVALAIGGKVVEERRLPGLRRNAAELLPSIDELLSAHAMRVRDVAVVAFSGGPGSFTGVRVAATVARMLHSVTRARVVRVSTLESIAENALQHRTGVSLSGDARPAEPDVVQWPRAGAAQKERADILYCLPVLDAKRGQVYAGGFAFINQKLREFVTPRVIDPRSLLTTVAEIADLEQWLAAGEGVHAIRELLEKNQMRIADPANWYPTAGSIARCGLGAAAAGQFADVAEMLPIYLRPPECEEVYDARRKAAMERRGEGPLSGACA